MRHKISGSMRDFKVQYAQLVQWLPTC